MTGRIDTESVDTHLDEAGVAIDEIIRHRRMLRVEIDTVAGNLSPPA